MGSGSKLELQNRGRERERGRLEPLLFDRLGAGSELRLREAEQALRFGLEKFQVVKRLETDVLPANFSGGVHEECAMQRHLLEVVICAVSLEGFQRFVRQ